MEIHTFCIHYNKPGADMAGKPMWIVFTEGGDRYSCECIKCNVPIETCERECHPRAVLKGVGLCKYDEETKTVTINRLPLCAI